MQCSFLFWGIQLKHSQGMEKHHSKDTQKLQLLNSTDVYAE